MVTTTCDRARVVDGCDHECVVTDGAGAHGVFSFATGVKFVIADGLKDEAIRNPDDAIANRKNSAFRLVLQDRPQEAMEKLQEAAVIYRISQALSTGRTANRPAKPRW